MVTEMGSIGGGMDLKEKVWVQYWKHLSNLKSESEVTQSCPTLCDPRDCSLPGSSVHGIFQARILEWVVISFSRSSQPRDRTHASCIGAQILYCWATREAWHQHYLYLNFPIVHKKGAWYSLVPSSLQNLFLVLIDRLTHISPLLNFYHIHS